MFDVLLRDTVKNERLLGRNLGKPSEQRLARNYARSVFSLIEGACTMLAAVAKQAEREKAAKGKEFSQSKLAVLSGESYVIDENGELKTQKLRSPFLGHTLFVLKSFQEAAQVAHKTTKGQSWDRIKRALQVRHRITHPKNVEGLRISHKEISDVAYVVTWFCEELLPVFNEVQTAYAAKHEAKN